MSRVGPKDAALWMARMGNRSGTDSWACRLSAVLGRMEGTLKPLRPRHNPALLVSWPSARPEGLAASHRPSKRRIRPTSLSSGVNLDSQPSQPSSKLGITAGALPFHSSASTAHSNRHWTVLGTQMELLCCGMRNCGRTRLSIDVIRNHPFPASRLLLHRLARHWILLFFMLWCHQLHNYLAEWWGRTRASISPHLSC